MNDQQRNCAPSAEIDQSLTVFVSCCAFVTIQQRGIAQQKLVLVLTEDALKTCFSENLFIEAEIFRHFRADQKQFMHMSIVTGTDCFPAAGTFRNEKVRTFRTICSAYQ